MQNQAGGRPSCCYRGNGGVLRQTGEPFPFIRIRNRLQHKQAVKPKVGDDSQRFWYRWTGGRTAAASWSKLSKRPPLYKRYQHGDGGVPERRRSARRADPSGSAVSAGGNRSWRWLRRTSRCPKGRIRGGGEGERRPDPLVFVRPPPQ